MDCDAHLLLCTNRERRTANRFSVRTILLLAGAFILAACGGSGGGKAKNPALITPPPPAVITVIDISQPWMVATPASVGMDEVMLTRAVNDAAAVPRFRSLLVARHGKLVSQNYFAGTDRSTLFDLRSVTKSVVSMLTGIALASGQISSLDATVGEHVRAPYVLDAGDRNVTLRQLLTMTSRYQWDENSGDDYNLWVVSSDHVQFLLDRAQNSPANTFTYDSAAVNLLGFALQDAVAQPLEQFAQEKLFQPAGISTAAWEQLETGMVNGGSGISMSAEDLLRFGQLLLQRGRSGTTQIVPESWIGTATTPQFSWRDTYGAQRNTTYGYLWWVADAPAVPAAFGWGYGGQFVYAVPSLDLVVVTTTNWQGISAEINPTTFGAQVLTIIVSDVLPAARTTS
jgi:CubicO group peptidase (beta-lactamase class C family)